MRLINTHSLILRMTLRMILCVISLVICTHNSSAKPVEKMAEELARLRSEVEESSRVLEQIRDDQQARLRALINQKLALSTELQRARLRAGQLRDELNRHKREVRALGEHQRAFSEPLVHWLDALIQGVNRRIPYKEAERRDELVKLRADLRSNALLPAKALTRTWSWVEDELRLTRQSSLDSQVITIESKEVLAKVARIGMVAIYCQTPAGRYGVYDQRRGVWTLYPSESPAHQALHITFERFESRQRVGLFTLPFAFSSADHAQGVSVQ